MSAPSLTHAPESLLLILDLVKELAAPLPLEDMLTKLIDAGRKVLQADRGTIFLYDANQRELFSTIATGAQQIRFGIERGIAGECARNRCVINVPDCYADTRFNPEVDRKTGYRTQCLITLPLVGLDDQLVGVMQLLNKTTGVFDAADERIASVLGSQAAVAIQRARLLDERMVKIKLERDLAVAREIQMAVLPRQLPEIPGYSIASFARPAEETGGDIYDVIPMATVHSPKINRDPTAARPLCEGLMILLADATGHGIGPALSVTQVRAMLRMAVQRSYDLDDMVTLINRQLTEDLAASRFVTAFFGMFDPAAHLVYYHAAGQGPLLHFQAATQACVWHDASTIPLGIMEDPPMDMPQPLRLAPGDFLVLLTDGFYEYQNPQEVQWGKENVGQIVTAHHHEPAQAVLNAILAGLDAFAQSAPQLDDLTALVLKREVP